MDCIKEVKSSWIGSKSGEEEYEGGKGVLACMSEDLGSWYRKVEKKFGGSRLD
jgi:hypothetical protein